MALSKQWLDHIEAWQSSGLKQSAYCRQHGLNTHTFTARLSAYRKSEPVSAPGLIPVQVQNAAPPAERLVLLCSQGHRLELPPTVSAVWLAELLRCLA
ncbi:MAG: IS66 family insertion sequence element accessory protein TnpB [Methylobacter tundripaludum]|nr:IS66 family insertion sequence element accessory protein TnpB [Methylobacter tundripaludum]